MAIKPTELFALEFEEKEWLRRAEEEIDGKLKYSRTALYNGEQVKIVLPCPSEIAANELKRNMLEIGSWILGMNLMTLKGNM